MSSGFNRNVLILVKVYSSVMFAEKFPKNEAYRPSSINAASTLNIINFLVASASGLGSTPSRGTAFCSWATNFTLIVPLFTQVYKFGTSEFNAGSSPGMDQQPMGGSVKITLVASC